MPGLINVSIFVRVTDICQKKPFFSFYLYISLIPSCHINIVFVDSPCWSHAHRCVHFAAAEWGKEFRSASKQTILSSCPDGYSSFHRHTCRPPHCSKDWFLFGLFYIILGSLMSNSDFKQSDETLSFKKNIWMMQMKAVRLWMTIAVFFVKIQPVKCLILANRWIIC